MITFSSTYYLCVKATFFQLLLHKSAKFKVTPKGTDKITILEAFRDNAPEILFSVITIAYTVYFTGISGWMIWLAYVPTIFSPLAELTENRQSTHDKYMENVFNKHRREAMKYRDCKKMDKVWNDWRV